MRSCFFIFIVLFFISCTARKNEVKKIDVSSSKAGYDSIKPVSAVDASTILAKRQVPVLCYHHIKDVPVLPKSSIGYTVTYQTFKNHMKVLADSGYHTVLPDQLYEYLVYGKPLPEKPVMITFDDTHLEQFTIGAAEMHKHNFKGTFFIMNISIGRKHYMSKEQIRQLSDDGNFIEAHTWDHHKVNGYTDADWDKQLNEAIRKLQTITGKPVEYFAYPFGIWDKAAIQELQKRGIKMAFQLSAKRDSAQPLYTVRRTLVPGTWTMKTFFKAVKTTFY